VAAAVGRQRRGSPAILGDASPALASVFDAHAESSSPPATRRRNRGGGRRASEGPTAAATPPRLSPRLSPRPTRSYSPRSSNPISMLIAIFWRLPLASMSIAIFIPICIFAASGTSFPRFSVVSPCPLELIDSSRT
jgi:hypothetical protein